MRTAEFGENKYSNEEIEEIAEAYLEKAKENDSLVKDVLPQKPGVKCTKEMVSYNNKGFFVKAHDYWSSLEAEGYKKLSDN